MSVVTNSKERTRFVRFISVGAIGAIVDFGIMNLFSKLFNMPLTIAGTISFICAIISNFIFNRIWTYPDSRSRTITRQLTMFFIVNVAGLAIRLPILHYLEPPMLKLSEQLILFYSFNLRVYWKKPDSGSSRQRGNALELFYQPLLDL